MSLNSETETGGDSIPVGLTVCHVPQPLHDACWDAVVQVRKDGAAACVRVAGDESYELRLRVKLKERSPACPCVDCCSAAKHGRPLALHVGLIPWQVNDLQHVIHGDQTGSEERQRA